MPARPPRHPHERRQLSAMVALAMALGVTLVVLATTGSGPAKRTTSGSPDPGPSSAPPSTTLPATSSTTSPPGAPRSTSTDPTTTPVSHPGPGASPTPVGTYAVTTTSLSIVEPLGGGLAPRSLPTTVWLPATTTPSGPVVDRARSPYPLVVFSQGFDISVGAYQTLLADWASAGFVVAAPTYPHTDPSDPAALDESDIVYHPADLRFVISTLLDASQSGGTLAGLVDPSEIALAGQSDGGDVSLAVAANTCCQDSQVKAVAVLSGAELASFGGQYFAGGQPPMLVTQGDVDTTNPPPCSTQIYDAATQPKYYLDLLGAGHKGPYTQPGPDLQVVAQVSTDFFEATLLGQQAAAAAIIPAGNLPGVSTLTDGPDAPPATGSCPGA